MNFSLCRILLPVMNGTIPANTVFPRLSRISFGTTPPSPPMLTTSLRISSNPPVFCPTFTHPDPDALAYAFPPNGGWNSGDLTADSGGTSWHMSVDDLLDVMGCFRRQGTIMSPAAAQTMLDDSFGIDLIESDDPWHALQQERLLGVWRQTGRAEPRLLSAS
jgi:hypothetical protein